MTKAEIHHIGENIGRLFVIATLLGASVAVGVEFHSWAIGLAVGLGLLQLHGINSKLIKLTDE
jgi:hypothetical protein